jgi:hypothetical protein
MTFGALAISPVDVAFFSPPPHRPERPERRTDGGRGIAHSFIRAFRRELARAVDAGNGFPESSRYPY